MRIGLLILPLCLIYIAAHGAAADEQWPLYGRTFQHRRAAPTDLAPYQAAIEFGLN
jgi:hypothetical protein